MTLSPQNFSAHAIWDYVIGKRRAEEAAAQAEAAVQRAEQTKLREAFEGR
jgi:hypothetical protein